MIDVTEAKAAALKQQDAQEQVRSMTENAPGVIHRWLHHPDGSQELLHISSSVRKIFDIDPKALMADPSEVWRRIHPDDLEAVEREMFRSAGTLEPYHVSYRLILEEKGTRWVEAWSIPSRLENGDIIFDGIVIDVTDLGRLDSLERDINFRQIFDNAPNAVFLVAADSEDAGRIVAANKAAEYMHGYDVGELKGQNINELDSSIQVPERLERLATGEVLTFEINHRHRDGTVFPAEITASRITIGGRPYVLAFDRDLTERKKVEKERSELQNKLLKTQKLAAESDLTKTQTQLQKMTENIPGLFYQYVLHADGSQTVSYIGARCREYLGVEPEEILEDAGVFWRLLEPEDLEQAEEKVARSARTLERYDIEYRVSVPGQGIRWYNDIGQPQRQPNGDIVWDGVMLDVTDRREVELANEVLAKATKSKDMFLANMSHELRTPLSAILGMTEGLKQGVYGETSPKQLETLEVVEESGLHLLNLINEILDLAKIETGKTSLTYSAIDVAELCKSCLDLVSSEGKRKEIRLSVELAWELPELQADKTRLRQILINLIGNAVKFTPDGGEVKLKVEKVSVDATSLDSDALRFTVADNGVGIESDRIDSIFEPFVQVDGSFSRQYPGSGLGLSLVKRFVELHSGAIDVQSEPGKGSRFTVDLPYANRESISDSERNEVSSVEVAETHACLVPESNQSLEGNESSVPVDANEMPLILLAEDNDNVARAVTSILEASGFRVLRAGNGEHAIELTLEHFPDLILMDVQMPVMDGLEAIRRIRSNNEFAEKPIIALSGFAMKEDSTRCIEAGADSFFSKPFKMPTLISEIRHLVSESSKAESIAKM